MLTEHHRLLHRLAGRWRGAEMMATTRWAPAGPAESEAVAEVALGGTHVFQSYRQVRDGRTAFESRAVFAWDGERERFAMFLFDTMGFVPDGPGIGVRDGDGLEFTRRSARGAGRHRYVFADEGRYRLTVAFAPAGGDWTDMLEGDYQRLD
ncbi:DUF1579 family protein [Labrys wisconsinensis]|uniref:DUF1579 domain-containing protein n=1 Tax=Labrys wisconsinensis TaxID=425677 RepID=A0ABU0JK54_9HYPH|nr:DUF1579 family protein [Labrys wisconsinensis]MDQ0474665.1 hypothetical protein [Labrys wisconsinensis]